MAKQSRGSSATSLFSVKSTVGILIFTAIILTLFGLITLHNLSNSQHELTELENKLHELEERQKKVHLLIKQAQDLVDKSAMHSVEGASDIAKQLSELQTQSSNQFRPDTHPPLTSSSSTKNLLFPPAVKFSSSQSSAEGLASVLVVGGTDGSGTRRVVQVLTQLGVTMVSEDPETYDIHGDLMGGWPPVVAPVVQATKSLFYSATKSKMPAVVVKNVDVQLRRLVAQAREDSKKPQSFILAKGGRLATPANLNARSVEFGFKAPVAMTLAPWWLHVLGSFKFLHVVRDGRDIAFSANQGPVDKFYNSMYGGTPDMNLSPPLRGIKLWSDWNSQVFKWAQAAAADTTVKDFSYLLLHSEDLVSDSIAVKFAAISKLAAWTGSTISEDGMCCIAIVDSEFMGSHDRTTLAKAKGSNKQVTARYGKWRQQVARNPQLGNQLHAIGKEGLDLLGYFPMRDLATDTARSSSGYQCKLTREQCGVPSQPPTPKLEEMPMKTTAGNECGLWEGVDFKGGDLLSAEMSGSQDSQHKTLQCCQLCQSSSGCLFFTLDIVSGWCYLKTNKGDLLTGNNRLVSGKIMK